MYCPVVQGDQEVQKGPDFREDLQDHKNPDLGFPSVLWVHDYQGTQKCQGDLNRQPKITVKIILTYKFCKTHCHDIRVLWMIARVLLCGC